MMSRMQRNLALLELLYKSTPHVQRVVVGNVSADLTRCVK